MPKASSAVTQLFNQIWHLPDSVRWMDPLPAFHRRGIIIAIAIVLLAFLWPSQTPQRPAPRLPAESQTGTTTGTIQAELTDPSPAVRQPSSPDRDTQGTWRNFQIASGQTLAQLFRDNNLPVNDVFAMAQVEGDDKPLSTLRTGQTIRIRQNAEGIINGLTVGTDNEQVLFTRQPDGSFIRAQ